MSIARNLIHEIKSYPRTKNGKAIFPIGFWNALVLQAKKHMLVGNFADVPDEIWLMADGSAIYFKNSAPKSISEFCPWDFGSGSAEEFFNQ